VQVVQVATEETLEVQDKQVEIQVQQELAEIIPAVAAVAPDTGGRQQAVRDMLLLDI
jgi:hypothetical protein